MATDVDVGTSTLTYRVTGSGLDRPEQVVRSPVSGARIGSVPRCTPDDVDAAVSVARDAQHRWRRIPPRVRARILMRFHDKILDHREELLDLIQMETGKDRLSASEEVVDTCFVIRYYARMAPRLLRPRHRYAAFPFITHAVEYRRPRGVVAVISPWNYPFDLPLTDSVPALLAGNAVVAKPASDAPLSVLRAAELLDESGLPPGVFCVVTGSGAELGPALADRADYVMFTGSTQTGRTVAQRCAGRLIDFTAELGGKNAAIVLADVDLPRTVEGVLRSCFSNSGQLCTAAERVYVERGIADRFVELLAERVPDMRLGGEIEYGPEMGSLTSAAQLEKTIDHVRDAVDKGARVVAGGRTRPDLGPFFFEPTVLTGVTDDMRLAREETFGPVIAIYPVADADEAVARANDTPYGLNADIWTRDIARGRKLATRLDAGTVNINERYAASWVSTDAPMGGMKDSGMGRRHGREGLLKYTEPQTVAIQRLLRIDPPPGVSQAAYIQTVVAWQRLRRRIPFIR